MPGRVADRYRAWVQRNFIALAMTGMITVLVVVFFAPMIFITVPAGHAGVLWMRFFGGTVTEWEYESGMKVIPPWDKIIPYDLRLQVAIAQIDALTIDGLSVQVNVAIRFRLYGNTVGFLHKNVGPDYIEKLIIPAVAAQVRHEVARYSPEALYSAKREKLEREIAAATAFDVNRVVTSGDLARGYNRDAAIGLIDIEDILIREVALPDTVRTAISAKNVERHRMEQYVYILERERQESQRKVVEATGIRLFQEIVSSGISDNYLKWKGIDATLKLAESNNSKVVVIGAGKEGLPLILGNWDDNRSPAEAPAPAGDAERGNSEAEQNADRQAGAVERRILNSLPDAIRGFVEPILGPAANGGGTGASSAAGTSSGATPSPSTGPADTTGDAGTSSSPPVYRDTLPSNPGTDTRPPPPNPN